MTTAALIEAARADGLRLRTYGSSLALEGPTAVVNRWEPSLAANKHDIMVELDAEIRTELDDTKRINRILAEHNQALENIIKERREKLSANERALQRQQDLIVHLCEVLIGIAKAANQQ